MRTQIMQTEREEKKAAQLFYSAFFCHYSRIGNRERENETKNETKNEKSVEHLAKNSKVF